MIFYRTAFKLSSSLLFLFHVVRLRSQQAENPTHQFKLFLPKNRKENILFMTSVSNRHWLRSQCTFCMKTTWAQAFLTKMFRLFPQNKQREANATLITCHWLHPLTTSIFFKNNFFSLNPDHLTMTQWCQQLQLALFVRKFLLIPWNLKSMKTISTNLQCYPVKVPVLFWICSFIFCDTKMFYYMLWYGFSNLHV